MDGFALVNFKMNTLFQVVCMYNHRLLRIVYCYIADCEKYVQGASVGDKGVFAQVRERKRDTWFFQFVGVLFIMFFCFCYKITSLLCTHFAVYD